jgi:2-polyprenyl-3-methyl-5-hydroxy-6-metoxy-1,4-benzoquinol methylase
LRHTEPDKIVPKVKFGKWDVMPNWLRSLPGYAALSWFRQVVFNRNFRETALLRAFPPLGLFQPTGYTDFDRHPDLFTLAREAVGDGPDRQLLSFGCSTGEEVLSLRRYFPTAQITGLDISPRRIRKCRRRARELGADPGIRFAVAASAEGLAPESFDAIFANSVFRHSDLNVAPPQSDHWLRFCDFEKTVSSLARCVRCGGLLIIRHANFSFIDTQAALDFEPILIMRRNSKTPLYDTANQLVPLEHNEAVVFRRRS